jgi:hypothetical protein
MREVINEPVGVYFISRPGKGVKPLYVSWRDRDYKVEQLSHTYAAERGLGRCHIYCLVSEGQYFQVLLDPWTMIFTLQEVHDGVAS